MNLLTKISNVLGGEKTALSLTDNALATSFERFYLNRRKLRITDADLSGGYVSHELVYACINKIADVMGDAEIIVEQQNKDGEWERKGGHPLTVLFKRPNSVETGRDFRRLMVQSENTSGIFYAEIIRSNSKLPVEFYPLNPNRITPRLNQARTAIAYYEYARGDGRKYEILPENMLIRRRVDFTNRFYGLAPLQVALKSVNSDLGMTDYIDAFFESDGTPSGILKILNTTVSDIKKEALQSQWRSKYGRGGSNQKGLAVLDQNAEYQKIGSNLDELDATGITSRFESRICTVFGVPPILVGALVGLIHTTTNATAKAALRDFWDNKISGELSSLREWLTWFVLPEFENIDLIKAEKVRVGFDISHVKFLQEDADAIHTRARENVKAGIWKVNEAREATGMMPDADGDYYLQPYNVTAISPENRIISSQKVPAIAPPKDPAKDPIDDGKSFLKQLEDELNAVEYVSDTILVKEKKTFDLDGLTLGREPRGVELLIDLKRIALDYESEKQKVIKILKAFRNELIDQAAGKLDNLTPETAYTLTLEPDAKRRREVSKAIRAAYNAGRAQVRAELAAQVGKGGFTPESKDDERDDFDLEYLDELSDGLISRLINEITARAINEYLTLKLLLDYTIDRLRELLGGQSEKFLESAAGSAVNAAVQNGRDAEMREQAAGIKHYEYSAILDLNTCGTCEEADGQIEDDIDDLPQAPNPECDGGDRCRCFRVAVIV